MPYPFGHGVSTIDLLGIESLLPKYCYLSNGLFFFERCSRITATSCAYKLNNARYENLFAHAVAIKRLHLSKKNNPLLIFTFLKHLLRHSLIYSYHYVCFIVWVCNNYWNNLLKSLVTVTLGHKGRKKNVRCKYSIYLITPNF